MNNIGLQASLDRMRFAVLMDIVKKKPLKTLFLGVLSHFLVDKNSTK